jgi:hypothetical protein
LSLAQMSLIESTLGTGRRKNRRASVHGRLLRSEPGLSEPTIATRTINIDAAFPSDTHYCHHSRVPVLTRLSAKIIDDISRLYTELTDAQLRLYQSNYGSVEVAAGATLKKSLIPFFCLGSMTFPLPVFVADLVGVFGLFSSIPIASKSFSNSSCKTK